MSRICDRATKARFGIPPVAPSTRKGNRVTCLKVAFVGWGAINSRVGELLEKRGTRIEIVGIATNHGLHEAVSKNVTFLNDPASLAAVEPTLVVEAASRSAVEMWAPSALRCAKAMIVTSTSALRDICLLTRLCRIAETHGSRLLLPSGAIGGLDALGAAAMISVDEVVHEITKPPEAWIGTVAEQQVNIHGLSQRRVLFEGTARHAADQYPQNANATVLTSLTGIGLDQTKVLLVADPSVKCNQHRITARGAFGSLEVLLKNEPLKTNPKSSELTALSLVRMIEQEMSSLII